jgi:hypothetical protein
MAGGGFQLVLHPTPNVFYWIPIQAVARPLDEGDVRLLLEPLHDNLGLVARGSFLEKVCCLVETHEQLQLVIQKLQVTLAVHHLTLTEKLNTPTAFLAETPQHHDLLRVFHGHLGEL